MIDNEIGFVPDVYTVLREVPDDSLPNGLYVYLDIHKEAEIPEDLGELFGAVVPAYSHRRSALWWHALTAPTDAVKEKLHGMGINYLDRMSGATIMVNHLIRGTRMQVSTLRSIAYFLRKTREWILRTHKVTGYTQTRRLEQDSLYALCQAMEVPRQNLISQRALYDVQFQVINDVENTPWHVHILFKPTVSLDYLEVVVNSRGVMMDFANGSGIREIASWLYTAPPIA